MIVMIIQLYDHILAKCITLGSHKLLGDVQFRVSGASVEEAKSKNACPLK